jgi:hypothetical protein
MLIASHPIAMKRREHQLSARDELITLEVEHRSWTHDVAEIVLRPPEQIPAGAERVLEQDWVADHHCLTEDRQIHGERAAVPPAQSGNCSVLVEPQRNRLDGLGCPRPWW